MTTTMRPPTEQRTDEIYSGTLLLFGISLVILGVLAIFSAVLFTFGTVLLVGCVMVAAGIAQGVHAFRTGQRMALNLLSSLLYLIAGGVMLWNPFIGALSLTLVVGAFLVVAGFVRLSHGFSHRKEQGWGWFVSGGIIDVILGVVIGLGWPVTGLWLVGLFVGIEMLIHGVASIALSSAMRGMDQLLI